MTTLIMRMNAVDEQAAEAFAIAYLKQHRNVAMSLVSDLQKQTYRFGVRARFQLFQIMEQLQASEFHDIDTNELDREIGQNFGIWLFNAVQQNVQDQAFCAAVATSNATYESEVAAMMVEHEQRCLNIRKSFEVQVERMREESDRRWAETSARMDREYAEAVAKMRAGR